MEKIYRLKLCAKHEYTNRDRKRPNEKIKVEKFKLGVAYLNLGAASIDYRLLIVLLLLIGYFAPYPDFAQLRNTKLKLCAYTARQTYQLTEISMQHDLITRDGHKLLQIKDTRLKRDDITKIKCVFMTHVKREINTRLKV